MIPYGRQDVTEDDIEAVVEILRSDFLTQGPAGRRFEQCVREYCGASHAVAVNSGTSALHLACRAIGLAPGERLWTTAVTFVASANCGRYCGADVDFVDIDGLTGNLSIAALEAKLARAEREGRLPRVVVAVHLGGHPCDMESIGALSERYGFAVIEDASHALGATYDSGRVGHCRHSDITVFSFHPVKLVTTGEGGVAVTNDPELAGRMGLLRSHGITRDATSMRREPDGPWYYEQIELGYNYRMTDLQAALGASQMARLDGYVETRRRLADEYGRMLAGLPVVVPPPPANGRSAWHLYVIRLRLSECAQGHRAVFEQLRARGIGVNLHYIPLHLHPYYQDLGFARGQFPAAEAYYDEAITLPLHPRLSTEDQHRVVRELERALA